MSTRQNYHYNTGEEQRKRLEVEISRRKLDLAVARGEKAQAELHRLARDMGDMDTNHIRGEHNRLSHLLDGHRKALANTAQAIQQTHGELEANMANLRGTANEVWTEKLNLTRSISLARQNIQQIELLNKQSLQDAGDWGQAERITAKAAEDHQTVSERINHLERQIRFVSQNQASGPAAMAVLICMEENGYVLKGAESAEGLTSYFSQSEEEHQIAIRMTPAKESNKEWELLAETYDMEGEDCLWEMEDFETAMEEMELGDLTRGQLRVYPKTGGDLIPRQRARKPHSTVVRQKRTEY